MTKPDAPAPAYCAVHQHYKWCEHNGGVMSTTGYEAPAPDATVNIDALIARMEDSQSYVEAYIEARAALRAAVEQIVAENRWFREAIKVSDAEDQRTIDVLKERAERAEREVDALKALSEKYLEQAGIDSDRAEQLEQEAAALRELLHEILDPLAGRMFDGGAFVSARLLARIDAALKGKT